MNNPDQKPDTTPSAAGYIHDCGTAGGRCAVATGSALVTCYGREDEMVVLHQGGKHAATLYASCPEQANDFVKAHGRSKLKTVEDWQKVLAHFAARWTTKYPDAD